MVSPDFPPSLLLGQQLSDPEAVEHRDKAGAQARSKPSLW